MANVKHEEYLTKKKKKKKKKRENKYVVFSHLKRFNWQWFVVVFVSLFVQYYCAYSVPFIHFHIFLLGNWNGSVYCFIYLTTDCSSVRCSLTRLKIAFIYFFFINLLIKFCKHLGGCLIVRHATSCWVVSLPFFFDFSFTRAVYLVDCIFWHINSWRLFNSKSCYIRGAFNKFPYDDNGDEITSVTASTVNITRTTTMTKLMIIIAK